MQNMKNLDESLTSRCRCRVY